MAASFDPINVREFLSKWDNNVYKMCADDAKPDLQTLANKMDMSIDNVNELENVCSLDRLEPEGVPNFDKWDYLQHIPVDAKLMCVRFQKQELEKRKQNAKHLTAVQRKLKYKKEDEALVYNPDIDVNKNKVLPEDCRVIYPDVLLTVHVHRPVKINYKTRAAEEAAKLEQNQIANSLMVLGRQKLTDLRDMVRCVHDLTVPGDMSENPDMECQSYSKDVFKSGFFFIENTFYNDLRESDARDYSKEIREWAAEHNMGPYNIKRMEETTFLDLTLRLGTAYLYMHQGDCQHVLVFSDIRLLTSKDPQDVRVYPYLTKRGPRHRTLCRLCNQQAARWITYGSEFTPENPCFFCDLCFRSLHYDTDNKKIGEFQAYRYFDHHAIV